jgi:hypothetical protein
MAGTEHDEYPPAVDLIVRLPDTHTLPGLWSPVPPRVTEAQDELPVRAMWGMGVWLARAKEASLARHPNRNSATASGAQLMGGWRFGGQTGPIRC